MDKSSKQTIKTANACLVQSCFDWIMYIHACSFVDVLISDMHLQCIISIASFPGLVHKFLAVGVWE